MSSCVVVAFDNVLMPGLSFGARPQHVQSYRGLDTCLQDSPVALRYMAQRADCAVGYSGGPKDKFVCRA